MSYENVVREKLKLKGKALDVQSSGVKKKKKKDRSSSKHFPTDEKISAANSSVNSSLASSSSGSCQELAIKSSPNTAESGNPENLQLSLLEEDYLTPAERKFHDRRMKLEKERLAKWATKSHRDRIMEFNQYLANLSEHYDIPKVGPG